jgi:hypothetical protein
LRSIKSIRKELGRLRILGILRRLRRLGENWEGFGRIWKNLEELSLLRSIFLKFLI